MFSLEGGMAQFAAAALANVPNPAFKEQTELAEVHRSHFAEWMEMVGTIYAGSYQEEYGPVGILEEMVRNSVFWRHWSEVKQRVHLLSGAEPERGACSLPRVRCAVSSGLCVPAEEASGTARQAVSPQSRTSASGFRHVVRRLRSQHVLRCLVVCLSLAAIVCLHQSCAVHY